MPELPPPGHPLRFTTLAHAGRRILGPISDERLDSIVERVPLADGAQVVELGCGKAELLVRLLAAWPGVRAVGIDRSPWFLADGRTRAAEVGVADRLELRDAEVSVGDLPSGTLDLAVSIGAGGILGDQAATLAALGRAVRPGGGLVLYGDGVWVAEPPAGGLEAFGMDRAELPDGLDGHVALGRAAGLEAAWSELVSVGEWDAYESAYVAFVGPWLEAHPDDPDAPAFRERAALMRESYAAWRRASMGFAITLFRRP